MERAVSLLGLGVMILLAWLLSRRRWRVPWRTVGAGVALQFVLALLVLRTTPGKLFFTAVGDVFTILLNFVEAGSAFVFGPSFAQFYFAFKVLPIIIFVSALMSMLYHVGLMQRVVAGMALLMRVTMRLSGAEALAAAANVFVGQSEAPLVVRPYIPKMTQSELMALMVGGFTTIAGSVLAAYVSMGIDAGHLITASVISAPAALAVAKILQPETETPQTLGAAAIEIKSECVNLIEAAAAGASEGLRLALNIAAMLIAFLALIALFDASLQWVGGHINHLAGWQVDWRLGTLLGYAFAPLAWCMGVESRDCLRVGELLGLKLVANEFIAYERLSEWMGDDGEAVLSERSVVLATYALCGFSNFSSIGIQIGGIGALAPERRGDLARLGLRAMLGGTLACCMTACVAGVLL